MIWWDFVVLAVIVAAPCAAYYFGYHRGRSDGISVVLDDMFDRKPWKNGIVYIHEVARSRGLMYVRESKD